MEEQIISLQKACRIAKKYIRKYWDDNTQIFLANIKESDQAWVFQFLPFIPKEKPKDCSTVEAIEIHGITGCIPIYYGSGMYPVRVEKITGEVFGIYFHFLDHVEGRVDQYYASFKDVDVMTAFEDRKSKGVGYSVKWLKNRFY